LKIVKFEGLKMENEKNQPDKIYVSESVDIVTELVVKTDDLRSKFKGISFKYNLGKDPYDFDDEVFFYAPLPPENKDSKIGSLITLHFPITNVIQPFVPDFSDPKRDRLLKILVNCDCEYMREGKTFQESQYEIVLA
jgi:hypothetical protein